MYLLLNKTDLSHPWDNHDFYEMYNLSIKPLQIIYITAIISFLLVLLLKCIGENIADLS